MLKLPHNCIHLTHWQSSAQNSPSQASTVYELRTSRCSSWFSKRQRNQRSNYQHPLDHRKSKGISEKISTSALLTTLKPFPVWIARNYGKFLERWEYQTTVPVSCKSCMQVKKKQLEPDTKHWTGFKLRKEYMPGWMKHKLELRLLEEILITSDRQMTPPLWQKAKRN